MASAIDVSQDGGRVAVELSGATAPPDVWVWARAEAPPVAVTGPRDDHGLDLGRLVRPEPLGFTAHDGLALSGWLYRPPHARAPGPVVLNLHGGPEGQERPCFRPLYQALAVAGIAVFAALVDGGVNTEPWMAETSKRRYGDPDTQVDLLRALSPIHRLDQVAVPTIVLHGANDTNVPVIEAEQVVRSLRRRRVPVDYLLFADEGHGFSRLRNRIAADTALVSWFTRYLRDPPARPTSRMRRKVTSGVLSQ